MNKMNYTLENAVRLFGDHMPAWRIAQFLRAEGQFISVEEVIDRMVYTGDYDDWKSYDPVSYLFTVEFPGEPLTMTYSQLIQYNLKHDIFSVHQIGLIDDLQKGYCIMDKNGEYSGSIKLYGLIDDIDNA